MLGGVFFFLRMGWGGERGDNGIRRYLNLKVVCVEGERERELL